MDWFVLFFVLAGSLFGLVASIGVLRLPDFFNRAHAATKAGAFGGLLLVLAAVFSFGSVRACVEGILILLSFYATAPVAAQMLGRISYRIGIESGIDSDRDEWMRNDQELLKKRK